MIYICTRNENAMKTRIEYIMKQAGVTQQRFAEMLGISAGSLSSILTGRTNPTFNHAQAIHKVFPDISLNWLMFGEGEMYGDAAKAEPKDASPTSTEPGLFDVPTVANNGQTIVPQIIREVRYTDKPPRQITEIRIFFDDGTFETFSGGSRG